MGRRWASSSIRLRLLAATLLILPLFFGLTLWGLDRSFSSYQLTEQRERMRLQQLLLAKAADWTGSHWQFESLDEPRLELLNSGLYAFVLAAEGEVAWHSPSAGQIGDLERPSARVSEIALAARLHPVPVGQYMFRECELDTGYYCYASGIAWGSTGPEVTFLIIETQANVIAAREDYRGYLLMLSLGLAVLLLLAQAWVIRWGLLPLGHIARDIGLLEQGKLDRLEGEFPGELVPLTDSVNLLLGSERRRRERVRNMMDRLAHVLKSPLMLLRNSRDNDEAFRLLVQEQVDRMLEVVEGELARARLDGSGPDILGKPVEARPVLERIVKAYSRLPRGVGSAEDVGALEIDTSDIHPGAAFQGEERDLQDLFGSILENSLKYCRQRIAVAAVIESEGGQDWLLISVADDGDGIPQGYENEILSRGARADTANTGQGLGLAIVVEIASAYGGSLHTDSSELGGALFMVRLPGVQI